MSLEGVRKATEGNVIFNGKEIPKGDFQGKSVEDLSGRLTEIWMSNELLYADQVEEAYSTTFTPGKKIAGFLVAAVVICGLTAVILLFSGHLTTFPHDFMNWIHNINYTHLAIGGSITVVLLTGAAIVIHRARTKRDELLADEKKEETIELKETAKLLAEKPKAPRRGAVGSMSKHLETALLHYEDSEGTNCLEHAYIDTSTLVDGKDGKAFLYVVKDCTNHYTVSILAPVFGTPLVLIGSIVYNLIRAVIIPFYVIVQLLREKCTGKPLYPEERPFKVTDIFIEPAKSVWRAIKAPFYALAFLFAGLYSLVNPMGGRKLGAAIERDWNEGVTLNEGYWSIAGSLPLYKFEGGGGPKSLGRNGFYLAGCWQPTGVATYENGKITKCESMEKVVDPINSKWRSYQVFTRTKLENAYSAEKHAAIITEFNLIHEEIRRQKDLA